MVRESGVGTVCRGACRVFKGRLHCWVVRHAPRVGGLVNGGENTVIEVPTLSLVPPQFSGYPNMPLPSPSGGHVVKG